MPTLEQALKEVFTLCGVSPQDSNEYINYIRSETRGRIGNFFEKIKKISPDISFEEAETIASYTSEEVLGGSEYSPYKLLNKNLVSEDRKSGLKKISKYFFILLSALRKLPRFIPEKNVMFRCIKIKVNYTYDPNKSPEKNNAYYLNNEKTFWAFSSATEDIHTALGFLEKKKMEMKKKVLFLD